MTERDEIIPLVQPVAPRPDPHANPEQFIHVTCGLLDKLGLEGELAASRRLLERSEELATIAREAKAGAARRLAAERDRLLGTEAIDPDRLAQVLTEAGPWLDANLDLEAGLPRSAHAMAALMEASEQCRHRAVQMVAAEATGLHAKLAKIAAEVVAHVATLPALPQPVWSALAAEAALTAIQQGHEHTWAALVHAGTRFHNVHLAAQQLRDTSAFGIWNAPGCPEGIGSIWRQWEQALEGHEAFRRIPGPLRIRYAIDRGWEPGLWTWQDIANRPQAVEQPGPLKRLLAFGRVGA